jgi:hypothetical protein
VRAAEHGKKASHPKVHHNAKADHGTKAHHHTKSKGASAPGSKPSTVAEAQADALKFAQCMRNHGVSNFPDNAITVTPQGGFRMRLTTGSGVNPRSPQFQSATQACRGYLPHGDAGTGPSPKSEDKLLKYSQCMRDHGVTNFPEPNSSGQVQVIFGKGPNAPAGSINPNSPQYQAAAKACRKLQPGGFSTP